MPRDFSTYSHGVSRPTSRGDARMRPVLALLMERYTEVGATAVRAQWSTDQLHYFKGLATRLGLTHEAETITAIQEN